LEFRSSPLPEELIRAGTWNGALVLDANHDERSDLLFVGPGQPPVLLLNQRPQDPSKIGQWFEVGACKSPPLLQAQVVDVDLDGWTDVIGLSEKHLPVLLHNDGLRLTLVDQGLGADADWAHDLLAVSVADVDNGCFADLLVWSEKDGLQLRSNQRNGNHGLLVGLSGGRAEGGKMRSNNDAFGTWVVAQSSDNWAGQELTTLSAGLGQSRQPLVLGLGPYAKADVLRLRWPDGVLQAELELPACQLHRIAQENRAFDSCPLIFAWNGKGFGFVTDCLGAASVGESEPDGGHRQPRPEESVKIEAEQLVPLNGQYVIKLGQPMDEVTYLDRLQLIVLDHPEDVRVYPDERFAGALPASQELLAMRPEIFPVRARDQHGDDVSEALRHWDRNMVEDFAHRSWLGFAEDHWVELDFGDRLAGFGPKDRLILCLAGWTEYPYPESIWAANQAGVAMQVPVLERLGDDGVWQSVAEVGLPAGLPRMMTFEVTGKMGGPKCIVRLRTNLEIFWDQIFVAPLVESVVPGTPGNGLVRGTCLEVQKATLSARPCMKQYFPDGKPPTVYDYEHPEAVPVNRLAGKLTRFGDVTDLLQETDDCFVLFGPGDDLDVRFDATRLPELPTGWKRDFVLRTWGYCKDCSQFTATGETIEPLPFRAMTQFPYGPNEHYPDDPKHKEYLRTYNTRQVGLVRDRPTIKP
jgi:hypothetical protein